GMQQHAWVRRMPRQRKTLAWIGENPFGVRTKEPFWMQITADRKQPVRFGMLRVRKRKGSAQTINGHIHKGQGRQRKATRGNMSLHASVERGGAGEPRMPSRPPQHHRMQRMGVEAVWKTARMKRTGGCRVMRPAHERVSSSGASAQKVQVPRRSTWHNPS